MTGSKTIALVCPDGISVLLFCKGIIKSLQSIPDARVLVITASGEYHQEIERLGVRCHDVPIARWLNPIADLTYCRRLTRIFRDERCEVVLNFSTKANIYGSLAAGRAGVPHIVSHVVGLGAAFLPARNVRGRLLRALVLRLYRRAMSSCQRVWFTNKNDLAFFVECGIVTPDQVVLSRNYLDVSAYADGVVSASEVAALRAELGLTTADQVVVMVARMIWPKGIREFAEAAERLRATRPTLWFLLVAPLETGSPDAVPETFVREMEQRANLRWFGFRRDVKTFYALSDIAVLPSYYKEGGYPRALLEPMSMGRPLVTTTSEDCRATVDDGVNGYLVAPRDAAALAAAIDTLAGDPARRAAFGQHSREKARREFDEAPILHAALRAVGLPVLASPSPE